jgi:hypothetical protein
MDEKYLNKIICVAYGDASLLDKLKIYWMAGRNAEVKSLLDEYKAAAQSVHELKLSEFDPAAGSAAEEVLKMKLGRRSVLSDLYSVIHSKPVFASIVSLVLVGSVILSLIVNRPVQYNYSQDEIMAAEKDAEKALQIIGNVFNQTSLSLKNDVLNERVSKPINEGLGIFNNILKGDKNEIN